MSVTCIYYSCVLHINRHVFKNRVHLFSNTLMTPPSQKQQCDIFMPSPHWWKTYSLSLSVLLWFPFQNTVFMTAVNLQKTLFSYWSGSFWFGLTAKTIIGTCGALQCTFHTALTKSCKRDWFRGGLASVLASRYEIILVSAFQSHWENSHQQMAGQTFKVSLFSYSAHLFDV